MVKYITAILFLFAFLPAFAVEMDKADYMSSNEGDFEKNLISRGRVELMMSFHKRDSAEVLVNMARLDSMNYGHINSISRIEKEIVLLEMELWQNLLQYELAYYKNLYNTLPLKKQSPIENDELSIYVDKIISKLQGTLFDRYSEKIANSELSDSDKDELEILLLLHDAPDNFETKELVAKRSRSFAARYLSHPDAEWIEKCVGAPYSHIYFDEMYKQDNSNRKERTIEDKLYTDGFGVNALFLPGGFSSGLNSLYDKEIYETEKNYINLELYLQVSRFAFIAELMASAKRDVQLYSLGVGMVIYDSRFFKIRPYLALGFPSMILKVRKNVEDDDRKVILWKGHTSQYFGNPSLTVAANFDVRFLTARFFYSENTLFSMSLLAKIGVSRIKFESTDVHVKGVSLFFDIGLGMYFW